MTTYTCGCRMCLHLGPGRVVSGHWKCKPASPEAVEVYKMGFDPVYNDGESCWTITNPDIESIPRETWKKLAEDALDVQDACNLAGVLSAWARAREKLLPVLHEQGTEAFNHHWVNVLWASKVASLTGCDQTFGKADRIASVYAGRA